VDSRFEMFDHVLQNLAAFGVLDRLMIVGGWCPYLYRIHFDNTPYISSLRTMDIDFLIPRPLFSDSEINVDSIIIELGFSREFSGMYGDIKYVHPELEIEFLTSETGRSNATSIEIKSLHIRAQKLKFLSLLQQYPLRIEYRGLSVNVPEPAAFCLHKFILSEKRENSAKKEKDLLSAIEIAEFLLWHTDGKVQLKPIYQNLPKKWQSIIKSVLEKTSVRLYAEIAEF